MSGPTDQQVAYVPSSCSSVSSTSSTSVPLEWTDSIGDDGRESVLSSLLTTDIDFEDESKRAFLSGCAADEVEAALRGRGRLARRGIFLYCVVGEK